MDLYRLTAHWNLSSWLDTVFLNENGRIDKVSFNYHFLVFYKTGDNVSYKFYDSNLDNEIESRNIRMRKREKKTNLFENDLVFL